MKYRNYIFDFDGTICDSRKFAFRTFLELTKDRAGENYRKIRDSNFDSVIDEFKNLSIKDLRRKFKINIFSFIKLVNQVQVEQYKYIKSVDKETLNRTIPFYDGIIDLLKYISKNGGNLYLLSSNKTNSLTEILSKNSLDNLFIEIFGGVKLFGKASKLNTTIKKYSMKKEDTVYIGDEVRDIEACKKVGIDIASVTWGYSGEELLQKYAPTYLCTSVDTLKNALIKAK